MPILAPHDMCCGCAACSNKCAHKAIAMLPNQEGFLHPVVDSTICIECGICETVCPGITPLTTQRNSLPLTIAMQHKDDVIRYQSTSGGAFTAIAEYVINRNGVVYGAAMTSDFEVCHIGVDNLEQLSKFRNSKYVQSSIGDSYSEVKKYLSQGRLVCFSGTPCQVNGLCKYLGRDYDNLITIDIVCKSVPSPLVFRKYVELKSTPQTPIKDIVFRDKQRGFLYCTMAHYSSAYNKEQGKSIYRRGSESDEWLRLFLSGRISRRACFSCLYQTLNRPSDFTLGDIWETGNRQLDDNKGSTLVYIWTKKGREILDGINDNIRYIEYPAAEKLRGICRNNNASICKDREQLFYDVNLLTTKQFFDKYTPYSFVIRLKQLGRYLLYKIKLQAFVRHIKHVIIHR